jgi:hypothetical protein
MPNDLTDDEKQFLALAIQGLCVRTGPELFPVAVRIAEKLSLTAQLRGSLLSWVAHGDRTREPDSDMEQL